MSCKKRPRKTEVELGGYLPVRKKFLKNSAPLGRKWLVANFGNWTSGNVEIDVFIRKHQRTKCRRQFFIWIDPSRLKDIEHIADGGFASVYRAKWLDCSGYQFGKMNIPRNVVLKTFKGNDAVMAILKELANQWECVRTADDDFYDYLPKIYGITKNLESKQYALVIEYFWNGDLRTFLQKNWECITWWERCSCLQNIAHAFQNQIHGGKILHCDLHTGNILNEHGSIRYPNITDFGISRAIDSTESQKHGSYGVIPYMAPELFRGQPYSTATDMYALGMIMWELSSHEPPFSDRKHDFKLMLDICDGIRPAIIDGTPECWVQLMQRCWDSDPSKRPTAKEICDEVRRWEDDEIINYQLQDTNVVFEKHLRQRQRCKHSGAIYTSRFIPNVSRVNNSGVLEYLSDTEWEVMLSEMAHKG